MNEKWYKQPQVIYSAKENYASENRKFQGIPSIEITKKGRLFAAWQIGGDCEPHADNCCVLAISDDGGESWLDPYIVLDHKEEEVRLCNPVLWIDPLERLWIFWSQTNAGETEKMGVWAMQCENTDVPVEKLSWTDPKRYTDFIIINKPIVTDDGKWLYTAQDFGDRQLTHTFCSEDNGESFFWIGQAKCNSKKCYFSETMLLVSEKKILQYSRLEDGAEGGMEKSFSYDGGKTWTDFVGELESPFRGPGSRFYIRRLKSGKILLVNHNHPRERRALTAYLSADEGKTWTSLLLDDRENISYPDGCQGEDGTIWIIYDRGRNTDREILTACFKEEDVLSGNPAKMKLISKGKKYYG